MKMKMKCFLSILFGITMMLGVMCGMRLTALANTTVPADQSSAGGSDIYFVGFTPGTASGVYQYGDNCGASAVFDGDGDTKICCGFNDSYSIEFSYSAPIIPKAYYFRTGGDTSTCTARNPSAWTLYGKDSSGTWVVLDNKSGQTFTTDNNTAVGFSISNTTKYINFKLTITAINSGGNDSWPVGGKPTFQLSEFYMSGENAPAGESHTHNNISFTEWTSTTGLPDTAGNYCLTDDVALTSTWEVPSGTTSLCLNGYSIVYSGNENAIKLGNSSRLDLYDCGMNERYYKINGSHQGEIVSSDSGFDGSFTGGYISAPNGRGITTGGESSNAILNMYGGTVFGCSKPVGAGIYSFGHFNMYGGAFIGNYDAGNQQWGGIVYNAGELVIEGGIIRHNYATRGSGVFQEMYHNSTCTIKGGQITDNTATINGGGVYLNYNSPSHPKFIISGNPVITGNKVGSADNNVYLPNNTGQYVSVGGELSGDTPIGISMQTPGVFTSSSNTSYNIASKFTSDSSSYVIGKNADNQLFLGEPVTSVTTGDTTTKYVSLTDALSAWTSGSTLTLLKDVTTNSTIIIDSNKNVTLDLNNHAITRSGYGRVIEIQGSAVLTIVDTSTTKTKHYYDVNNSGPAILKNTVDVAHNFSGGYITGGNHEGNYVGGGIYISGSGTLNLNGGTVFGNSLTGDSIEGSGIYVDGTLNIDGGNVIGNYNPNNGGGIGSGIGSTISIKNARICDNKANWGAGITVRHALTIQAGSEICNNSSSNGGGGGVHVDTNSSTVTMTGGIITGNSATNGGGINTYGSCTLNISGGEITGNTCTGNGGGINLIDNGSLHISGSVVIRGNTKSAASNNVYLGSGKTITVTNPLTAGASIGVSTADSFSSTDVKIATGASQNDIRYIHSDNQKKAGVVVCYDNKDYQCINDEIKEVCDCAHSGSENGDVYLTAALVKKITYDANGANTGSAPADQDCEIGGSVAVAGNTGSLAKTGNKFLGWSKNTSAKVAQYRPGDTITLTSDMLGGSSSLTLYAVWVEEAQMPLTIQNNGYPWGSNMSSVGFTLNTGVEEDIEGITYQWQSKADGASTFEHISDATNATYTPGSSPVDGTWYRCLINNNPTEAIQVIKPEYNNDYWEVTDLYGRIWTNPYYDTSNNWNYSWYISNGTMAYTVDTAKAKFDMVGAYTKDSNTYMLQTAFGGDGWQMYSSSASHPGATDYYFASPANLDSVKFAFSRNNPNELLIEADLGAEQQSFSFGADTQLGNYETSGGYADYAALEAQKKTDNTLNQIVMVGAASTTESDAPAFVIRSKDKDNVPFYYLGGYYERQPFGYNSNDPNNYGWAAVIKNDIKATGLGTVSGVTKVLNYDTGMTMSWYDIPAGGSVKFGFSVGSAKDTGAVESAVNYGMEVLEGLDPGTEYTITCDGEDYKFTSTTEGTIALAGTDESNEPKTYDFIGKSISVKTGDKDPQTVSVAARPTGVIPVSVDNTIASKPIEIRESDYAVTKDSITLNFDVTDNSATAVQKRTQEYRIYDANGDEIEGCGWVKSGADGKLTFSGLTNGTTYIVNARIPATETAPCSDPVSNDNSVVKTAANITVNTPAANSGTTTVTLDGSDKDGATVTYSTTLDEVYADETPSFNEGGKYTVYYRVVKENSQPLYGSYEVKVNCTVTLDAQGGTLIGTISNPVTYGNAVGALADPSNGSLKFAGWYADEAYTKLWSITENKVTSDMTLYARWVGSLSNFGFSDDDIATFQYLQLFKGNVAASERKTVNNGTFSQFTNIPDGEYQMVITTNDDTGNKVISLIVKVENNNVTGTATKPEKP